MDNPYKRVSRVGAKPDTLFAWMQADEVMRKRAYDEWMKSHD